MTMNPNMEQAFPMTTEEYNQPSNVKTCTTQISIFECVKVEDLRNDLRIRWGVKIVPYKPNEDRTKIKVSIPRLGMRLLPRDTVLVNMCGIGIYPISAEMFEKQYKFISVEE